MFCRHLYINALLYYKIRCLLAIKSYVNKYLVLSFCFKENLMQNSKIDFIWMLLYVWIYTQISSRIIYINISAGRYQYFSRSISGVITNYNACIYICASYVLGYIMCAMWSLKCIFTSKEIRLSYVIVHATEYKRAHLDLLYRPHIHATIFNLFIL